MMMRILKRIGFGILILVVIIFIFQNDEEWKVEILFLGDARMPAYAMIILTLSLGCLIGFLTPIWLRKRRENRATGS